MSIPDGSWQAWADLALAIPNVPWWMPVPVIMGLRSLKLALTGGGVTGG